MKTLFFANMFAIATAATTVGLNLVTVPAFADEAHGRQGRHESMVDGHHGGGHGGMRGKGQHRMDRMLSSVGASEEQKTKIREIFAKARADINPDPKARQANHQKMRDLLAAPTVDRAALEQLRSARVADHDRNSKRMSQAMADAAEVLTPDQRAKFAAQMKERQGRMGRHHGAQPPAAK
jgi:periplasmic protein CpxP/Spy